MDPDQILSFLPPATHDPARQAIIDHAGRIDKFAFKVSTGVFFAIAVCSVVVRLVIRAITRRRLFLDDYLVFLSSAALCVAFSAVMYRLDIFFVAEAMANNLIIPNKAEFPELIALQTWNQVFCAMAWLSIFSIKFAFLAFYYPLIMRRSKALVRYFWSVVAFNAVCWIFFTFGPIYIICPHFGKASIKCAQALSTTGAINYRRGVAIHSVCGTLDIITDILVISVPFFVLHPSMMRPAQKLSIGAFLSLSLAMVIVTLIRLIGSVSNEKFRRQTGLTVIWAIYWNLLEACVAVTMASAIVIRTVFIQHNSGGDGDRAASPNFSWLRKKFSRSRGSTTLDGDEGVERSGGRRRNWLPSLRTGAMIRGLTVFGIGRSNAETSLTASVPQSEVDLKEFDYHTLRRMEAQSERSERDVVESRGGESCGVVVAEEQVRQL